MKKLRLFKIGKGVHQGCILSPCLFNLHAEYIMWNAGLDEAQAGIQIAGRNINNLRYADNTTLMAESKEKLKSLLMKVKEESEKAGLKLNVQKMKIMASSPITSWQIVGGNNGNSDRLYFLRLQNHCRWWLQPWNYKTLVPWKKSYNQPRQHIKKQRQYFANKGPTSQSYGFPSSHVWMWQLGHKESWVQKNWCFLNVVLEKTLESPLNFKEIQPVHPKEMNIQSWIFNRGTHAEAKSPILWPPDVKNWLNRKDWWWERLRTGGKGDNRGWDGWMVSQTWWTCIWASFGNWWWTGKPGVLQSMGFQGVRHNWETEPKIVASSPITLWQIEGGKVEAVVDFLFLSTKIIVDGDCSHEIKRHLLFGRKAMTNLDSILKSRDIPLLP